MIVYEKQSTGFIMYGFSMIICMKDTHYKTRRRFITGVGATGAVALAGCTDFQRQRLVRRDSGLRIRIDGR